MPGSSDYFKNFDYNELSKPHAMKKYWHHKPEFFR